MKPILLAKTHESRKFKLPIIHLESVFAKASSSENGFILVHFQVSTFMALKSSKLYLKAVSRICWNKCFWLFPLIVHLIHGSIYPEGSRNFCKQFATFLIIVMDQANTFIYLTVIYRL
jgi:hypothetical protein